MGTVLQTIQDDDLFDDQDFAEGWDPSLEDFGEPPMPPTTLVEAIESLIGDGTREVLFRSGPNDSWILDDEVLLYAELINQPLPLLSFLMDYLYPSRSRLIQ